jgi:hypothetical protein
LRASFDAWLHAECGLTFQEAAGYTAQEIRRLKLGYIVRENPGGHGRGGGTNTRRKRELKNGQLEARKEMYEDLGVE